MDAGLSPDEKENLYASVSDPSQALPEDADLSEEERKDLFTALVAAFPSTGALERAVYVEMGVKLSDITSGATRPVEQVLALIDWAEKHKQVMDLVRGALSSNPGNAELRRFAQQYRARRRSGGATKTQNKNNTIQSPLSPQLRRSITFALLELPSTKDYSGRTELLIGVPGSLSRDPDDPSHDMAIMVDQLSIIDQLKSGHWPLLILMDNAIAYTEEPRLYKKLGTLRQKVAEIYGEDRLGLAR